MIVKLKNGEIRNVITIEDALEIVAEFAGTDVSEFIGDKFKELNNNLEFIQSEFDYSENRCEEYCKVVFHIQDEIDIALKQLQSFYALKDKLNSIKDICEDC